MGKTLDRLEVATEPIRTGTRARGSSGGREAAGLAPGSLPSGAGRAGGQLARWKPGQLPRSPPGRRGDLLEAETGRLLPGSGSVTQEPEYLLWQTSRCIS